MISCCDVAHCLLSMIRPMFLLVSSHALTSSPLFTHHLKFSDRLLISNSQKPACNAWRIRKKVESPSSSSTDWQPPPLQCCTCRRQRRQQKAAATDVHLRADTLVFLPGNWCLSIPLLLLIHRQKHQRTTLWTNYQLLSICISCFSSPKVMKTRLHLPGLLAMYVHLVQVLFGYQVAYAFHYSQDLSSFDPTSNSFLVLEVPLLRVPTLPRT